MKIILTGVEPPLVRAWEKWCGDLECIEVFEGSIFHARCEAVVSPANSFGFMDGGLDLLLSRFFGWHVQERLQELIRERHDGELLVGAAEIVPTDNGRIPFLISAPTMRVPMILRDSINPYLAARAALLLIQNGTFKSGEHTGQPIREHVSRVAFPGLGTGVGQVGPDVCAHQVRTAIEDVVLRSRPFPATWAQAQARHQQLYTDRVRDLQRPQ